jgi:VanZ family protein
MLNPSDTISNALMLRLLKLWLPVIVWAAIILSAANDEFSNANTQGWLARLFGDLPPIANHIFRKGGHIAAYAILGLLAWRAHRMLFAALAIVIGVAIADETMQSMTLTRQGSPYDVLLDTCGALLALICVPAVRERLSSRPRAD